MKQLLLVVCLLSVHCTRQSERHEPDPEQACASACATLSSATCPSDEPTDRRHASCLAACIRARALAETARCSAEHRTYLGCVSALPSACPPAAMTPGAALEHASGFSGCRTEHAAYFHCTEPCREQGVVRTRVTRLTFDGREHDVQAELVSAGCSADGPSAVRKNAPGAPCTHHSVCSASRCPCARTGVSYLARACVDGRCAESAAACLLSPRAVAYDPCR